MKAIEEKVIKELLSSRIKTRGDLHSFKRQIAKKYKIPILKNADLLKIYHEIATKKIEGVRPPHTEPQVFRRSDPLLLCLLRKRPVRSLSGIVNVSVLTKPWPCPGKCIFCPTEKNLPKSYLAKEPAVQRAIANKFSPYKQVAMRLNALRMTGHPTDKVELRIIGGTWSAYPRQYQKWFIGECFRACNEFPKCKVCKVLSTLHSKNERAKSRVVGIAVETRPDCINADEIKFMRELGITKVELGVQSIYDDVLRLNNRGHNVKTTITATRLLKDAGFKVSYQIMPGLYGTSFKRDVAMFRELFANPDFKPDYLKIYPLALIKNTGLYKLYQQGKFKPYTKQQLLKLLTEIKKQIPFWCRIERIIRDIPKEYIVEGGAEQSNLRQEIVVILKQRNQICRCIRCREISANYNPKEKIYLFREDYETSDAKEIFLSYENKARTKLFGLLRLRVAPTPDIGVNPDVGCRGAAIIRDLHVYGQMAQINSPQGVVNSAQHKGLGKKLLYGAEKIARNFGAKKISVISGVGARIYYRKLGYRLQNTYMVKTLK